MPASIQIQGLPTPDEKLSDFESFSVKSIL